MLQSLLRLSVDLQRPQEDEREADDECASAERFCDSTTKRVIWLLNDSFKWADGFLVIFLVWSSDVCVCVCVCVYVCVCVRVC